MFSARFLFADGEALTLTVAPDQTVLDAAMQADAPIRYDCASGTCGACVAHCVQGDTTIESPASLPVSEAEYAAGLRPTCLTKLRSDAEFHLPYPLNPAPSAARRLKGRVVQVAMTAKTVHRLVVRLDRIDDLRIQSGQYLRVRPPGASAARAYSIASTQADLPDIELLIRHVPGGEMSEWLKAGAQPGDALTLQGPLGAFGLDMKAQRHVFVAGGTGLAPVMAMAADLPPGSSALICFGCTRQDDLFHQAQLAALAAANRDLEVRTALIEPGDSGLPCGTSVSLLTDADLALNATYYLCGPPPMVEASRARLARAGVRLEQIRAERFAPGG